LAAFARERVRTVFAENVWFDSAPPERKPWEASEPFGANRRKN
jgi:hypothetical protein